MADDLRKALKKYIPQLIQARDLNLNEAETVQRLVRVFEDAFGYDLLTEISREFQVKSRYCDVALKIDGVVKIIVEAKAAAMTLRDRHIEQAERYAAEGNVRWVLLTNGICWNLYHLTFEEGVDYEKAFSIDLSADPLDKSAECLGILTRRSVVKGKHEEYWSRKAALAPESIARALFSERILSAIKRLIRRREGVSIDIEDIASSLHGIFSAEARERIGPVKIRRARARQKTAAAAVTAAAAGPITSKPVPVESTAK